MRTAAIVTAVSTALALAGLLTACDDKSPTGPSPGPSPGPSGEPSISRFGIVGPRTVAPGETAQFSMIIYLTDGSSRDVTNEASWSVYDWPTGSVLSIAGPGLATGRERGDATIRATYKYPGVQAQKEVIVVPAGTYRLEGLVTEIGFFPTATVAGARLEVTTGAGAGLFTTTGGDGRYRLYGVAGATNIRVTKDGYQPLVRTLDVADHRTLNVELPLSGPRDDRSGTYTLTIAAADDCHVELSNEAWIRRYTAIVTQRGPQLEVVLTGATFAVYNIGHYGGSGDRFRGRVQPGGAVFSLSADDYPLEESYPNLVEQLQTSKFLVVFGTVVATGSADRLAGTLDGSFHLFDDWDPEPSFSWGHQPIAECASGSHQFVLSR